jgi:hypothetical protein
MNSIVMNWPPIELRIKASRRRMPDARAAARGWFHAANFVLASNRPIAGTEPPPATAKEFMAIGLIQIKETRRLLAFFGG